MVHNPWLFTPDDQLDSYHQPTKTPAPTERPTVQSKSVHTTTTNHNLPPTHRHRTTDKAGHDLFSSEKPEAIEKMQEEQRRKQLTKVT